MVDDRIDSIGSWDRTHKSIDHHEMGASVLSAIAPKRLWSSRGQNLVEIALITPLVLVALYIPADFGVAMFTGHLTQNAVREAARIGVSTKDPFDGAASTAIKNEAINRLPQRLVSRTVTVKYYDGGSPNCLRFVEVVAQGDYQYFLYQLIRLFGGTTPNTLPISRTTRMRYEFQPYSNATVCTTASVTSP
ncbi:MAG: TadE/TadG family type IV pilus assembly protein [Candidatus Binatia bacterium]